MMDARRRAAASSVLAVALASWALLPCVVADTDGPRLEQLTFSVPNDRVPAFLTADEVVWTPFLAQARLLPALGAGHCVLAAGDALMRSKLALIRS